MPDIKIKTLDGKEFGAYCAMPASGQGPGMVVIQEIFGVNAGMRKLTDDFAAQGYIAVCPDIFWRQQPGVQLTDKTEAEWKRAFDLMNGLDIEACLRDLLATLAHVRAMPGCNGKVGSVGYCLGGKLAFLMSSRSDVDASVGYYAVGLEDMFEEIYDIRMPLLLHFAALDKYCAGPTRDKIMKALHKNPAITTHLYENVDHAFARPNGQNFNQAASDLAANRTKDFFAKYLKG